MEQKKAFLIAKNALKSCYSKYGIVAGKTHFNDYWARDSFYASLGALELKDYEIVKKNLELFLRNMSDDGQIPIRVGKSTLQQCLSFFGLKTKNQKPQYSQDKGKNPAIDPNILLIITLGKYATKTGDKEFVKKNLEKIHLIIDWLEKQEKKGLLFGGKYSTWQDMVKKEGFVLYTNVLYYEALSSLSRLLGSIDVRNEFSEKALVIKENINKNFWDKKRGYFIDFFNDKNRSNVFSSDGNFFAIIFGVANQKQAESILKKAEKFWISKNVPSCTNYPKYKRKDIFFPFYLLGMSDYNNGSFWTWLGCLHAVAQFSAGKKDDAKKVLEKLSKIIERDNDIYEVYEKSAKPMKRFFYKSERQFAWSAGFYIMAKKMVEDENKNNR